jgi:acetyl esterase
MSIPSWAFVVIPIAMLMNQTNLKAEPRQLRDVEYAQSAGSSLSFDASIPDTGTLAPAAIIVHGGGWVRGDRRTNVEPLFKPLADAGFAWFSISYTLATDPFQVGAAVSDVEAAIRFIRSHAAEYHVDVNRIVMIGESAGGQLAAMAALGKSAGNSIKAVVALYTPTDLVAMARNSSLIPEGIRKHLNGTPWEGLILARLGQLSPISAVHKGMPPFLFIHGDNDQVVPIGQSRAMCESMKAMGAACKLVVVPGGGHGLRWWENSPTKSEPYKREMVQWLQQQLAMATLTASR